MAQDKNEIVLQRIEETIEKLRKKESTLYFFVVDSKNTPNGSMAYIYDVAYTLSQKGYDVCMVYQLENEYDKRKLEELIKREKPIDDNRRFIGVGEWLGEKYMKLRHLNMSKDEWKVSPADFLFIPEIFSSLMFETFKHNVPCKRYVILQNFNYVTQFIPVGVQWANYGISDVITSNDKQAEQIKYFFPYVKTKTLTPCINECFRKPLKAKNLIVNIVAKNPNDVGRIIKTFYWKFPIYQFIPFRDLRDFPRDKYAELLKESAITVWVDDETPFGYSPLEAMRCGDIVIGKIPEIVPEWMGTDAELKGNGIWFNNINDVPMILAKTIGEWMQDKPSSLIDENAVNETNSLYTREEWDKNIVSVFDKVFEERIAEIMGVKAVAENKRNEKKEE